MNLEKTMKQLKLRGFGVSHFATGAEAAEYLCGKIENTEVGIGGCQTAKEIGLYEKLSEKNTVHWHWINPGFETIGKANAAPVYICSANALTEDGQILNIDGNGNRLAATAYGPEKQIYFIVGKNKVCPDFDSALERARQTAAVRNVKRFDVKTPCKVDDKCHDCHGGDCMCRGLLVLWGPMRFTQTEVILIDEELGF